MSIKVLLKKDWFLAAFISLSALIPRIYILVFTKSLSFDEMISFSVARKSLSQIWGYVKWEMHPPLHYYFLHFWFVIFGRSEGSGHSSSIFLNVLAATALYFLGKEIFRSRLAGLAAADLYAWSPLFCFYGVWARMYTMLILLATLSFILFLRLLKATGRRALILGGLFALTTLAALFTHLTAGLVPGIELVYLAYLFFANKIKGKELLRNFIAPAIVIGLVYGLWFWFFWHLHLGSLGSNAWYFNYQGKFNPVYLIFYDLLRYLTPFNTYIFNLLSFSLLAILGFSSFAAISGDKKQFYKIKYYFSNSLLLPLLILFLSFAGLFIARLFVLRYAVLPAIGLFLILGYGFFKASRYLRLVTFILFLVLTFASFLAINSKNITIDNWNGAADFVRQNEKPGDKIVGSLYTNILSLQFYFHDNLPMSAPLDKKYQGDNLLLTTIKTNIYPTTNAENVGQLKDFLGSSQRVFFIVSSADGAFPDSHKIVENFLASQGFVRIKFWPDGNVSSSLIWLMERKY